jgi:hypothetical protein
MIPIYNQLEWHSAPAARPSLTVCWRHMDGFSRVTKPKKLVLNIYTWLCLQSSASEIQFFCCSKLDTVAEEREVPVKHNKRRKSSRLVFDYSVKILKYTSQCMELMTPLTVISDSCFLTWLTMIDTLFFQVRHIHSVDDSMSKSLPRYIKST